MQTDKSLTAIIDYFGAIAAAPDTQSRPTRPGVSGQPLPTGESCGNPRIPYYVQDTLNLGTLDLLPRRIVKPCKTKYIVRACDCKRIILPHSCHRYDCAPCAPWTGQQRAKRIFNYIGSKLVCYTVFTVPLEIRHRFTNPKAWSKVRSKAWQILKTVYGAAFGMEASHPIGKVEGIFHPHLNFLWVPKDDVSPFIDVVTLRILWAHALGVLPAHVWKLYSQNPDKVLSTIRIDHVNVKHAYSVETWKIKHWCNYVSRTFPGYSFWTGRIRWHGRTPTKLKSEEITCPDCGKPLKVIGEISASEVHEYYTRGWLLGLDPPWYNNKNITRYKGGKRHARQFREDV